MGGAEDKVHNALSEKLELLTGNATFRVAEFTADAATIFEAYRDEHGTPAAVTWKYVYTDGERRDGKRDQWSEAMADPETFYRSVAPSLIVQAADELPPELADLLRPDPAEVPVYLCQTSLRTMLRDVMKKSPLVMDYELAVLTRVPADRPGAGRLVLTGRQLFSTGDTQGDTARIPVNCEPTDEEGTAFAVVTREPRPELPPPARRLRPLQVQAAVIPPGRYVLSAELIRPGQVRFDGLPLPLASSERSWDDLTRLVPDRLAAQVPVHLVCLTETCGRRDRLRQRIYWLEELITQAQAGAGPLRVTVVAYGAHGVAWKVDDRPPEIRAWAAPADQAIRALRGLTGRRADDREYQRAAQLECALKLVRDHLAPADGRPVIVTAGGRPPHPHELDTRTQLIPCPDWVNGRLELGRLLSLPEIRLGAFRDPGCHGGIWDRLGQHAVATVDDAVDIENFAADLGLRAAAQTVPFPVME